MGNTDLHWVEVSIQNKSIQESTEIKKSEISFEEKRLRI